MICSIGSPNQSDSSALGGQLAPQLLRLDSMRTSIYYFPSRRDGPCRPCRTFCVYTASFSLQRSRAICMCMVYGIMSKHYLVMERSLDLGYIHSMTNT
jgi:hypothetical protein